MDLKIVDSGYARGSGFSYRSLLRWEFGYVVILMIWAYAGRSEPVKLLANLYAFGLVLRVGMLLVVQAHRLDRASAILMGFVLFFAAANLAVNASSEDIGETIKILSLFMFYFAGQTTDEDYFEDSPSRWLAVVFVAVPVLSALVDLYRGGAAPNSDLNEQTLSFFANRNNAVAFTVISSWTLMLAGVSRTLIVVYLAATVLAFKTLGALAAVSIAFYLLYPGIFSVTRNLLIAAVVSGIYLLFGDDLEILSRASTAWRSLNSVLAESGGVWGLSHLDFADIYTASGTSDVSLIFRLKHWVNLLTLYSDGPLLNQLFGFGVGSSVDMTELKLVPHNDYLRFLFELGPGLFLCFVALNLLILKRTGRKFLAMPLVFIFIYFFSDNLVNNFLVMSFLYFTAGAISRNTETFGGDSADQVENASRNS